MTRAILVVLVGLTTGCLSVSVAKPSTALLARADRLVLQGEYPEAVERYDEFLAKYRDDEESPRVRASREAVARILAARAELVRLRGEVTRLRTEVQRLNHDLEELKRIDLHLDRRRP